MTGNTLKVEVVRKHTLGPLTMEVTAK